MRTRAVIIAAVVIAVGIGVCAVGLSRAKERAGLTGCGNRLVSIGSQCRHLELYVS
jgi:hypothetical protein